MIEHRPPAWAACLLLLAACGQSESPTNSSVTVKLPPAGAPVAPESSYSSIEAASCKVIGNSIRRCEGAAGYGLEMDGQVAIVAPDGRRSVLDLSKLGTKGAPKLGAKAEWRGPAPGHPNVLIVRVASDLVVARLEYPACIVAVVARQPRQNEKARDIADGKLPACLSG
jgi:hypothetical protein